jgi:hypothetical protein
MILAWGLWPISYREELLFPSGISRLEVRWPTKIRSGSVSSSYEIVIDGNQDELSKNSKEGYGTLSLQTISMLNNRNNHLLAEARLQMPEAQVIPEEMVSQPVLSGQPVSFSWMVQPNRLDTGPESSGFTFRRYRFQVEWSPGNQFWRRL